MTPKYFEPDFIRQVKDATDISSVVSEYANLKKVGVNSTCPCPFHDDKSPSFAVNDDKQNYTCYAGCDASGGSGDVFQFIMRIQGVEFAEALIQLAQRASIQIPKQHQRKKTESQIAIETTLDNFSSLFTAEANNLSDQFLKLCQDKLLDIPALTASGFKIGYTGKIASQIENAYKNQPRSVIDSAKMNGMLSMSGKPPFEDGCISVELGNAASEGIGFIHQNGDFSHMPANSSEYMSMVFGSNHLKQSGILKVNGHKRFVGDNLFIANNPLSALQLVSAGIPNVVSPHHEFSFGLNGFQEQLHRLHQSVKSVALRYLTPAHLENDIGFNSFLSNNALGEIESLIGFTAINDNVLNFCRQLNLTNSASKTKSESIEFSEIKILTPNELNSQYCIKSALAGCPTDAAEKIFTTHRTHFVSGIISAASHIADSESSKRNTALTALSKFGFSKSDYIEAINPGLIEAAIRRTQLFEIILGSAICNKQFAILCAGDNPGLPNPNIPDFLNPNEKMILAVASMETIEALGAAGANVNQHIKHVTTMFDDPDTTELTKRSVKAALLLVKGSGENVNQVGINAISELQLLSDKSKLNKSSILYFKQDQQDPESKLVMTEKLNHNTSMTI